MFWGSFFYLCDKIPEKNNLREEGFILAHGFRSLNPCLADPTAMNLR
jgi:hypothetical protein